MKHHPCRRRIVIMSSVTLIVFVVLVSVVLLFASRRPQRLPTYASPANLQFQRVAQPGFDADGQARLADSAWSMRYFKADGAGTGYVYVGTDNNIIGLSLSALKPRSQGPLPVEPPQIRRYRPDLGPDTWEVVFDYKDHEQPPYLNEGFRSMVAYKAQNDGVTYLYAGTMADHSPTIWRSATGDPGNWDLVFTFPQDEAKIGSVRGMVVHDDGLLYVSTTPRGDILPGGIGTIWSTDGSTFTPVVTDGFGSPDNQGIAKLASYNGCLYAGTYNAHHGFEVWKLRCTDSPDAPPQQVMSSGAGHLYNETVLSMHVFHEQLYIGTGIPLGFNPETRHGPHGCEMFRLSQDDSFELLVGPQKQAPTSGYGPGYGWYLNVYCWYMHVHEDQLYLGTWDMSRTIEWLGQDVEQVALPFRPLLNYLVARPQDWGSPVGGDLYRTSDGVHWEPVFVDGLGNPDNHGIRTMETTDMGLFVGTENPFTRLEVWLLPAGQ
jgi:hypothetical protein